MPTQASLDEAKLVASVVRATRVDWTLAFGLPWIGALAFVVASVARHDLWPVAFVWTFGCASQLLFSVRLARALLRELRMQATEGGVSLVYAAVRFAYLGPFWPAVGSWASVRVIARHQNGSLRLGWLRFRRRRWPPWTRRTEEPELKWD